jgi:competence ComEA-like helix-hairpin-helix protein
MLLSPILYLLFAAGDQSLPPGKGQELVQQQCAGCHALKVVSSKRASKQQWATLVDQMVSRGADIPDDEIETVIEYLSSNFGENREPASDKDGKSPSEGQSKPEDGQSKATNVNKATAGELAAGLGLSAKEASALVAFREQNGDFKTWSDVSKVPGIDAKKVESNKDRITF